MLGLHKSISPEKQFAFYSQCNFEFLIRGMISINLFKRLLWLPRRGENASGSRAEAVKLLRFLAASIKNRLWLTSTRKELFRRISSDLLNHPEDARIRYGSQTEIKKEWTTKKHSSKKIKIKYGEFPSQMPLSLVTQQCMC